MAEYVPRRLRRFYRKNNEAPQNEEQRYSQNVGQDVGSWGLNETDQAFNEIEKNDLEKIPSMSYEDLSIKEKNLKDIAAYEKKNVESSLAENEIEKFKRENKRLPSKQESEKIAENLYVQLKDNPIDYGEQTAGLSRRELRRHGRNRGQEQMLGTAMPGEVPQEQVQKGAEVQKQKVADIKSIIEDEPRKKKIEADEFDLGLSSEDSDGLSLSEDANDTESIDDLGNMDLNLGEEICPNCHKNTEKIIYCSKCGAAYCQSCAKKTSGNEAKNEIICPKCGTKTKI